MALDRASALGWDGIWALVFAVKVSSLSARSVAPPRRCWATFFGNGAAFYATLVMAALLFWRHAENIRRLFG